MTVAPPSRIGRTASADYRQMARSLNADALKAANSHRPMEAARLRDQARIAMKAAWAEEIDEAPKP